MFVSGGGQGYDAGDVLPAHVSLAMFGEVVLEESGTYGLR